tara:strand:+ start:8790 stop:9182 length:393 start_codon:yes stop_codon:yes gene_type:complete
MNNKGYIYFIEIILSVVFVAFLFFSLKPSNITYEIDDEYSQDLLYVLNYQELLNKNLNKTSNNNFESYMNDSVSNFISETKDYELTYNLENSEFSNSSGKTKSDLSTGNFHLKNIDNNWYTVNLYTWSKL